MKAPKMNIIPDKKLVPDDMVMEGKNKGKREIDPRPVFSVNAEEFPDIKDWNVGKRYNLEIEVEMVANEIGEWGDDKGKSVARFKICGIKTDADNDESGETKSLEGIPPAMQKKVEKK